MALPSVVKKNRFEEAEQRVRIVRDFLEYKKEDIEKIFNSLHPGDAAITLQFLSSSEREEVVLILGHKFDIEILSFLDESVRESILDRWGVQELAQKLEELEGQDALRILEELHKEERRALLRAIRPEIRFFLEEGLSYSEGSAGRLMEHQVVAIPQEWKIDQVRKFLASAGNLPEDILEIFVVDKNRYPIGCISLNQILKVDGKSIVSDIAREIEVVFSADADQRDVTFSFRQYSLLAAPVIDLEDRLIGVISVQTVLDIMHTEAQEDFLHSGGMAESDFYENWWGTSKARIRWLSMSIFASLGIAILISFFQDMIAKKTELAVLITIVMSMSGNAGVQVVTVIVRALVNRELGQVNMGRAILKELVVGLINGIILGGFFGLFFWYKFADYKFGMLLTFSLVASMLWTAIAGTFLPIIMNKFGSDPALSAGPFLGATIDAFSCVAFLAIATLIFR